MDITDNDLSFYWNKRSIAQSDGSIKAFSSQPPLKNTASPSLTRYKVSTANPEALSSWRSQCERNQNATKTRPKGTGALSISLADDDLRPPGRNGSQNGNLASRPFGDLEGTGGTWEPTRQKAGGPAIVTWQGVSPVLVTVDRHFPIATWPRVSPVLVTIGAFALGGSPT